MDVTKTAQELAGLSAESEGEKHYGQNDEKPNYTWILSRSLHMPGRG